MKALIITLSLAIGSFFTAAANDGATAAPAAQASFKNTYANATEVSWNTTANFYKVSFQVNGQWATAFYKADGSLVAATRNISSVELPARLQTALQEKLEDGGWLTELFVVTTDRGDTYFASIENAKTKTVLKSAFHKKWAPYQNTAL